MSDETKNQAPDTMAEEDNEPFDASKLIIRRGIPSMHEDPAFWEREHKDAKAALEAAKAALNAKSAKN